MADFNQAIPKLLMKEGGDKYTNIYGDAGGETKYGITKRSYPHLDIKNITEDQAKEIYKRDYWNRICGDRIEVQTVSESIFEAAVNMGVKTASKMVQLAIGADPDGIIGDKTIAKLNNTDAATFKALFTLATIARYAHICNTDRTQSKFLLGWINRVLGGA